MWTALWIIASVFSSGQVQNSWMSLPLIIFLLSCPKTVVINMLQNFCRSYLNFQRYVFPSVQVKGVLIFLKSLNVSSHQLNFKNTGRVFFCFRLYLGIETISCHLLLRMARMDVDWNLKKLGQLFQVLTPCLQKSPENSMIGQLSRDVIGRLSVKPWCYWLWRLAMSLVRFD